MRSAVVTVLLSLLVFSSAHASIDNKYPEMRDIFFGEALFYAFQDKYFDAISRLDTELGQYYGLDEPELDPFHYHIDQAEFSVGDFELSYRMHRRAGRAIEAVIEGKVAPTVRNEALYRLAKIYFQKQQSVNALHALEKISGEIPESIRVAESYLRAQVYIATGRFADAVDLLRLIENEDGLEGFAGYNLGIALIQSGWEKEAVKQLDKVGKLNTDEPAVLALKDKANLTLGYRMLEKGAPELAQQYLERVRLKGPFSNKALLGSGWVQVSLGRFDRALVPWSLLHKRAVTNSSVQEALLAVPYAYGKLDVHGKAAVMYGYAMQIFGKEVDSLDASIKSIREGKFLAALIRKEGAQDKSWLIKLRDLPDTPETHYIMDLMASHDFQASLQNYRDLAQLRMRLADWLSSLDVYEEIIEIRRRYYVPLLPVVEKQFKRLDSRMRLRLEQRDRLDQRLKSMLVSRRPEYLATVDERIAQDSLKRIEAYLSSNPQRRSAEVLRRLNRLKGMLYWQVNSEYDERLTEAYKHLHQLDEVIDKLNVIYQSFIRTRQAATQSYEGYEIPIRQLRTRIQAGQLKLEGIMARQGRMLETMAINELDRRRKRLEEYQVKARFALAESYDRATKKQEQEEIEQLRKQRQLDEASGQAIEPAVIEQAPAAATEVPEDKVTKAKESETKQAEPEAAEPVESGASDSKATDKAAEPATESTAP